MAEPENQTLHLLREIRGDVKSLDKKVDGGFERVNKRIDSLQQAMIGESVLGQYATAGIDTRLDDIEKRLTALEKRRS
jgi:hypothetical protein